MSYIVLNATLIFEKQLSFYPFLHFTMMNDRYHFEKIVCFRGWMDDKKDTSSHQNKKIKYKKIVLGRVAFNYARGVLSYLSVRLFPAKHCKTEVFLPTPTPRHFPPRNFCYSIFVQISMQPSTRYLSGSTEGDKYILRHCCICYAEMLIQSQNDGRE